MTPPTIGRYEVLEQIGHGGMAAVYRAFDPAVKREVAVKLLSGALTADQEFMTRFKREAEIIAALEYATIVPIYDFGDHGEQPYIVMRYMLGGTLEDRLKKEGTLPLGDVTEIMVRVADGLTAAHERGVIHRDLKPGNVLFDQNGDAFLADFGIVKMAEDSANLTAGAIIGTAGYMAPEQVYGDGEITHKIDIYGLGVMIYELLIGERPYRAETPTKVMMKHVMDPVPDILAANPDLPKGIDDVIQKTMAKKPEDRYETVEEFLAAVQVVSRTIPSRRQRRGVTGQLLMNAFDALEEASDEIDQRDADNG